MVSIEMLTFIIATFCDIKNQDIPKETRIECVESMTNCSIILDGKTTNKRIDYCRNWWINYERSTKKQ